MEASEKESLCAKFLQDLEGRGTDSRIVIEINERFLLRELLRAT